MHDITVRTARFDEPAVKDLLVDVMAELSERYGGSGDDTPVASDDFTPPNGAFFVAAAVVASGSAALSGLESACVPACVAASESAFVAASESAFVPAGSVGGPLLGCAGWRRHEADAELKRMFTVKAARGRGLARRLLAAVEDSARDAGCERLILETGDRQPEAIALYRSAGYVRIEDFGYYAGYKGVLSFARRL